MKKKEIKTKNKNVAQGKWTLKKVKEAINIFYKKHDRYPKSIEFDTLDYLPSSRHVQRKFGGLIKLRKQLGLDFNYDFTKGSHSSKRGINIEDRSKKIKKQIYDILVKKIGRDKVMRDFSLIDDKRSNVDFKLKNEAQNCAVDVFYSRDDRNLIGCINNKLRKFKSSMILQYPVILLSTNKNIDQDSIDRYLSRRKNPIHKNVYILGMEKLDLFLKEFNKGKRIKDIFIKHNINKERNKGVEEN